MATQPTNEVFVKDVWNSELNHALDKELIFSKWTTNKYEKDLKQAGDQVRILSIGKIDVKELDWSNDADRVKFESNLGDPDKITGASLTLTVNQIAYYQIIENDLEAKLRFIDTREEAKASCVQAMKDKIDSYVAGKAVDFPLYSSNSTTITANNVKKTIANLITKLRKQNVPSSAELKMEVPFEFLQALGEAYEDLHTTTAELLKNGSVATEDSGKYHGVIFEASNNCYVDNNNKYHLMLRTKRALAFVDRVAFSEMVRSGNGFADILRGYCLYDAKVIYTQEGLQFICTVDTTEDKYQLTKQVSNA